MLFNYFCSINQIHWCPFRCFLMKILSWCESVAVWATAHLGWTGKAGSAETRLKGSQVDSGRENTPEMRGPLAARPLFTVCRWCSSEKQSRALRKWLKAASPLKTVKVVFHVCTEAFGNAACRNRMSAFERLLLELHLTPEACQLLRLEPPHKTLVPLDLTLMPGNKCQSEVCFLEEKLISICGD